MLMIFESIICFPRPKDLKQGLMNKEEWNSYFNIFPPSLGNDELGRRYPSDMELVFVMIVHRHGERVSCFSNKDPCKAVFSFNASLVQLSCE
jgi:hypothetical protein